MKSSFSCYISTFIIRGAVTFSPAYCVRPCGSNYTWRRAMGNGYRRWLSWKHTNRVRLFSDTSAIRLPSWEKDLRGGLNEGMDQVKRGGCSNSVRCGLQGGRPRPFINIPPLPPHPPAVWAATSSATCCSSVHVWRSVSCKSVSDVRRSAELQCSCRRWRWRAACGHPGGQTLYL